jgi:hypothetical protein
MRVIVELSFRNQGVGGSVRDPPLVSGGDLASIKAASHLVFVIHGYNLDAVAGTRAGHSYCKELEHHGVTATLVRVLWPGDDAVVPLVQYTNAFINGDATGVALCDFIEREGLTGKTLDFVGNSLGNRVALVAMKRLQRASRPLSASIFVALASAIGSTLLADPNHFRDTVQNILRSYVTISKQDVTLGVWFPKMDPVTGERNTALGFDGPQPSIRGTVPSNVHEQFCSATDNVGHDDLFGEHRAQHQLNAMQKRSAKWVAARVNNRSLVQSAI